MKAGVSLEGLQVKSANLDDLFIKLTGHQLSDDTSTGDSEEASEAEEQSSDQGEKV